MALGGELFQLVLAEQQAFHDIQVAGIIRLQEIQLHNLGPPRYEEGGSDDADGQAVFNSMTGHLNAVVSKCLDRRCGGIVESSCCSC